MSSVISEVSTVAPTAYEKWLREDVLYITTDEERVAFRQLTSDQAREQFIEQFWLSRDPTPGTGRNEVKEEHYRRIAYANERFPTAEQPGWKSDRGRVYIILGPPDEIESHPSGQLHTPPYEVWRYRSINEVGDNVELGFVDPAWTGEYRLTTDKVTIYVEPRAGATVADLPRRFQVLARLLRLPEDRLAGHPGTPSGAVQKTTVEVRAPLDPASLQFQKAGRTSRAIVNVYGRVLSPERRVVSVFEEVLTFERPAEPAGLKPLWFRKSLQLPPGDYRLTLVFRDQATGGTETRELSLAVPAQK